jgi:hypothetical protein
VYPSTIYTVSCKFTSTGKAHFAACVMDPSCLEVTEPQENQILHFSCLADRWKENVFISKFKVKEW